MLKQRVITALVLLAILLPALFYPSTVPFTVVVLVLMSGVWKSSVVFNVAGTDVGLPGGMNGRQVADAARETRPDLKVLFITGYAENAARMARIMALGRRSF